MVVFPKTDHKVDKKITVSLVSHQQLDLCRALVQRLNDHCRTHIASIVLTHNLPETETIDSPHIKLIEIRNKAPMGFGANHNKAIASVETDLALIINPDILFEYDFLQPLVESLERPTNSNLTAPETLKSDNAQQPLALISPIIMNPDGSRANFARNLYTPAEIWQQRKLKTPVAFSKAAWIAGMCWLVKTREFKSLGGFDPRFFMYCEDTDFCARLRLAQLDFAVCTESIVVHDARRTSHRSFKYTLMHLKSALKFWLSSSFWRYRAQRKLQSS